MAGIVCSFLSLPPDNVKTKLMRMKPGPDGKNPYTGFMNCLMKVMSIFLIANPEDD